MKPNSKTNQRIFAISILHIVLFLVVTIRRLNHFGYGSRLSFWLAILSDLTFLIPLFYAVILLKFAGERKYIINYFTVFAVITSLNSVLFYLPQPYISSYSNYILIIVGIIISILILGVITISFNIKNPVLRLPYRGLAIAYILLLTINWGIPLLLPLLTSSENYLRLTKYVIYTRILPGLALVYIIYSADILLKPSGLE